jgi:hypothetical protein
MWLRAAVAGLCLLGLGALNSDAATAIRTTTLTISGVNGAVYSGLKITTTSGPCITISNSSNVTIKESDIGPCGEDNSTNNSRGISIGTNVTNLKIYDNYIHVENRAANCTSHSHPNIYIDSSTGPIEIKGTVIAYGQRNIDIFDTPNIDIIGNYLLNPRGNVACSNPDNLNGHNVQFWSNSSTDRAGIDVRNNYFYHSADADVPSRYKYVARVSDVLNVSFVTGALIDNNYLWGPGGSTVF